MASTYWARLNFRDASAATCEGLAHGSCWLDAEELGTKHDLEGKGSTREMATSGFSYGKCKGTLQGVLMQLTRTYSSRGPDRTSKGPH